PLSNTNDPDLCDSGGLRLDEWPWTAPKNNEASFCPFSGGFNFRTIRRLTNEDFCEEEWRRSRLDIECIKGDGMDFIAPRDSNCNPFLKQGDWKRLTCWVGWEHEDYVFLIASDEGSQPRYCLRFPRVQDGEFSVLVYFSVICPVEHDGKPHHGIEYYELRMFRKDKSSCKDEDEEKCREMITSPEMCVKDTIYAPHCPKTCGQCAMNAVSDINRRRCLIEPTLYGDWRLIDNFGTADVTIDKDKAVFSHLGTFQCLDKDNKGRRYKMASLFDNGCSPRYTCMEFNRRNNNVLQYKLSRSRRAETTMDELCTFQDDLPPLLTSYRSAHFKNLILINHLWPSYCGLQSVIPFNGTIRGLQCSGIVSDWNEDKCNLLGTISVKSTSCQELHVPSEYQCIAFIQDEAVPLQQLLLTKSLDNRHIYNCWVLTSYAGGGQMPWRVLYQLPTPQCSLTMEVDSFTARDYTAALSLDDRSRSKVCKPEDTRQRHEPSHHSKPKASDLPYAVPNQDEAADSETEVHVASHPPKPPPSAEPPFIDDVNTDPPMWDVYGRGNSIIHRTLYKYVFSVWLSLKIFSVSLWIIPHR
ncbi:unnamed protein product, partial [Candidula unifasciata]